MVKAELGTSGEETWQTLYVNGEYVASAWGEAEVETRAESPKFFVAIKDGTVRAIFHCDEVEYKSV